MVDEANAIKTRLDAARGDESLQAAIDSMTGGLANHPSTSQRRSLGDQFVSAAGGGG